MNEDAVKNIYMKSLLFWTHQIGKAKETTLLKQLWDRRDVEGFQKFFNECPYCNGAPVWSPVGKDNKPVIIANQEIDVIYCFCESIKIISDRSPKWHEGSYRVCKLDDIIPYDIPPGAGAQTQRILTGFQKFLGNPIRSALITGVPGCGKSHILHAIKTHFGAFAAYVPIGELHSRLLSYMSSDKSKVGKLINMVRNSPILLLDDLGMQQLTDFSVTTIANIIDYRYNARPMMPTIVTTNLSLDQLRDGTKFQGMERLASRMMDTEFATVMIHLQDDYRSKLFKDALK